MRKRFVRLLAFTAFAIAVSMPAWAQCDATCLANLPLPPSVTAAYFQSGMLGPAAYLNTNITGVPAGAWAIGAHHYNGWCVDVPQTVLNQGGIVTPLSTYGSSPALFYSSTLWRQINYIINNRLGVAWPDVQVAIWHLINPAFVVPDEIQGLTTPGVSNTLINNAIANGGSFVPVAGQVVAVLLFDNAFGQGLPDQNTIIEVPIPGTNQLPPSLSCGTVGSTTGMVGAPYAASVSGNGGTAPYQFTITNGTLPLNLNMDLSGNIAGIPQTAGTFPLTIQVKDSTGATGSGTCSVKIIEAPPALICGNVSSTVGTVGMMFNAWIVGSNGTAPFTYSVFNGTMPSNLQVNPSTGQISGIPQSAASTGVTFQVKDSWGRTATSGACAIVINSAPSLQCGGLSSATGEVGIFFTGNLSENGGTGPVTYSLNGSLPQNVGLNSATGVISGVPGNAGSFPFTVTVTDNNGATSTSGTCNLNVVGPPTVSCGGVTNATGTVGTAFSASVTSSGGAQPVTFSLAGGSLPPVLNLNMNNGQISGTPTTAGSYPFSIKVTDAHNISATSNTCNITVNQPNNRGPYFTVTPGGWGAPPKGHNPASILQSNFPTLFPTGITIGDPVHGFSLTFTSFLAIHNFLPGTGIPGVLAKSDTDPTTTAAGVFAGQLLAAMLSVDFSNAGITRSGLGDLHIASGPMAGYTLNQVLAIANLVLGGNLAALPAGMTVSDLNDVLDKVNNNFDEGQVNKGYLL